MTGKDYRGLLKRQGKRAFVWALALTALTLAGWLAL